MAQKLGRPHNFRALSKPKQLHKREHRHYLPYLPVILFILGSFLFSVARPLQQHGVLSYATALSPSGLLDATNTQRQQNGTIQLAINPALAAAAQAKANDMVTRNYWSHVTPDGQQPWSFVESAGYDYQKTGENLAYGFVNSREAVTGWMNSAAHRENMLDSSYSEVGFGFANSPDFNNSGPETVIVAFYGVPRVLSATDTAESDASPETAFTESASKRIALVQNITAGKAPWTLFLVGLVTGLVAAFMLLKHTARLRHLLRDSERFVLHHPLLDSILVSLIVVGTYLSQTTGVIR